MAIMMNDAPDPAAVIEGRLAALEIAAKVGVLAWARHMFATAYPQHLPAFVETLAEACDAGRLPTPTDPAARAAMDATLLRIFSAPFVGETLPGDRIGVR